MMSVAGRSYFRTCLSMLFMFIMYEAFSVVSIWKDFKNTELFRIQINPKMKIWKTVSFTVITIVCIIYSCSAQSVIYRNSSDKVAYEALSGAEMYSFTQRLEEECENYYANPDSDWNKRKDIMVFSEY